MKNPAEGMNTSSNVSYLYYFRIKYYQDPDKTKLKQCFNSVVTRNNLI